MRARIVSLLRGDGALRALLRDNSFDNRDIGKIDEIDSIDIFVISIPKCATTAIQHGFQMVGRPVLHAHNNLSFFQAFANGGRLVEARLTLERLCALRRRASRRPIYFFFGYREPVSWYLSLAAHFKVPFNENLRLGIADKLQRATPWMHYTFAESRRIVEEVSNIELMKKPFDRYAGYAVLRKGAVTVILYRFDRLDSLGAYVRSHIEPRFEVTAQRVNESPHYKHYRNTFRLPRATLETLYADSALNYFYGPEERATMIAGYDENI